MSSKPILLLDLTVQNLKKILKLRKALVGGNKEKLQDRLKKLLIDQGIEDLYSHDFREELSTETSPAPAAVATPKLATVAKTPTQERKRIGKYISSLIS